MFNSKIKESIATQVKKKELIIKGLFEEVDLKLMIEEKAFSELSLNNMHLSMTTYDNRELVMSIILSNISLREHSLSGNDSSENSLSFNHSVLSNKDIEDIMTKYKELMQSKTQLPLDEITYSYKQLTFSFEMNPKQEKNIEITLDALIVLIKLDTFLLLTAFFTEGLPDYVTESKENCPNSYDPNADNTPKMTLELKTNKVSLCLLSDSCTSNQTQDILYLSSEFNLRYDKERVADIKSQLQKGNHETTTIAKLNIKSKNVNIAFHTLNEITTPSLQKTKERRIINQPTIDLIYVTNIDMKTDSNSKSYSSFELINKITITFEEIEFKLSYRDIVTALKIAEYEQSLLNSSDYETNKHTLSKQPALTINSAKNDNTCPNANIKTQQDNQQSPNEHFDLNLTGSKNIRIILINNDNETYYPFLTLIFNSFFIINKSIGDSYFNIIASFTLEAYSFNYLASYWEPVIESFPFYGTLTYDATQDNEAKYSIDLKAENKDITNINISDLSIEFTYRNLKAWIDNLILLKSSYKTQINKVINAKFSQSISNHKVFNYSGRRMTLKSNKEQCIIIEENQSVDLDFYPDDDKKDNTDEGNHSQSKFIKKMKSQQIYSFTLDNVQGRSNFFDIDSLNSKYHQFNNSGSNHKYSFIVSKVELNGLKKHIYFLSPLVFRNKTQSAVQLIMRVKGKTDCISLLKPGDYYGVRSEYIFDGDIKIVFPGNEDLKLKAIELLTEPGVLKEKRTKDKYYLISYIKGGEDNTGNVNGNRIIEIRHSCIIKNCLPLNITLTLPEAKKPFLIKKNESQVIDCVSFYSILRAQIELEKIGKSTDVILFDPKAQYKTNVLKLKSNDNSSIEITATLYKEEERLIILHSEQILVNLAGEDIRFYLGEKINRFAPIPYQTNSINMFILNQNRSHLMIFQYMGVYSNVINLKELPSLLEVRCSDTNSSYSIESSSSSSKLIKNRNHVEYEFVLETKVSLIDIECNIYSTVLTLCPKYYIFNHCKTNLILELVDSKETIILHSNKKQMFDFFGKDRKTKVIIKPQDKDAKQWNQCEPIILFSNNLQTLCFNSIEKKDKLYINIEKCKETISTIFYLTEANESNCQFVFHNKTSLMNCLIYQYKHKTNSIELKANSSSCFALTSHSEHNIIICIENPQWNFIRFIQFKDKGYIFYSDESGYDKTEHIYSISQIISLKQIAAHLKITVDSTGFQAIITLNEEMQVTSKGNSNGISQLKEKTLLYEIAFRMNRLGLNIFGDNRNTTFENNIRKYIRSDLLYFEFNQIDLYYKYDNESKDNLIQFCLQELMISNETSSANYYPMLLSPINEGGEAISSKDNKQQLQPERLPLVNIIANYKQNQNNKMNVSELSFSFQAFNLKAESNLILALFDFIQNITIGTQSSVTSIHPIYSSTEENLKKNIFIQGPYVILMKDTDITVRETNLIIDYLSIPSFKVKLSFLNQSNEFLQTILKTNVFLSSIFGTMSSIADVPLNLNGCEIHRFTGNWADLFDSIGQHYKEHILSQAYKIFGGISILGSPNTFLAICSDGVNDLYKEPTNGFKKGPLQGFVGIAKGGASLVQHTVEGTFNSTSQVTSGISKAILLVSQDDEYMKNREMNKITDKPKNVFQGVGYGMKSFATGLFHGVTDIVVQPIKGAQEDNLKGFGKGLLKGFGGILSKPVSGLFDLVSKTTEGIKNNVSSNANEVQLRFPRVFYTRHKLIKNYNVDHAEIVAMIRRGSELYDKENLGLNSICSLILKKKKKESMLVFTSEGIIAINTKKQRLSKEILTKPILYYNEIERYEFIGADCICFILNSNNKNISIEFDEQLTNVSVLLRKLNKAIHNSKMN